MKRKHILTKAPLRFITIERKTDFNWKEMCIMDNNKNKETNASKNCHKSEYKNQSKNSSKNNYSDKADNKSYDKADNKNY